MQVLYDAHLPVLSCTFGMGRTTILLGSVLLIIRGHVILRTGTCANYSGRTVKKKLARPNIPGVGGNPDRDT